MQMPIFSQVVKETDLSHASNSMNKVKETRWLLLITLNLEPLSTLCNDEKSGVDCQIGNKSQI